MFREQAVQHHFVTANEAVWGMFLLPRQHCALTLRKRLKFVLQLASGILCGLTLGPSATVRD